MARLTCILFNLFLILYLSGKISAQEPVIKNDLSSINRKLSQKPPDPYRRPYMFRNEPSVIKKINPLNILYGSALFVYQNTLSRQIAASCLYSPGCSDFSRDAVRNFGIIRGSLLSVDRLSRCNRISEAGLRKIYGRSGSKKYQDSASDYKRTK